MSRHKNIIAFDAGSRTARLLWLSLRGKHPVVTRVETFSMPMDTEDPFQLVATWVNSLGVGRQFCSIGLPGSQSIFQCGLVIPHDPRNPKQVAAMDLAQFNEMAGDTMVHDVAAYDAPFKDHEVGSQRYLIAMARPAAIQKAIQESRSSNLRPADLIPAPVALYNGLESLTSQHVEPYCYVNIGHNQSDMAVGSSCGLFFARSIPVGGKLFTDAIANSANLPAVRAEVRKHVDCGLLNGDACYEPLCAAADRWLSQFNACLGVYRSTFPDKRFQIAKLVITGGGAQLKGLKEYLTQKTGLPTIRAQELDNIPANYREKVGVCDLALGLALTAVGVGKAQISLLPANLKNEVVFRAQKPWWIAAAIFLISSLGLYSATGVYLLKRDGALLETERAKLALREKADNRIKALRSLQEQVITNSLPLGRLLGNAPLAREVLTLVAQTVDTDDWITMFCDQQIYNPTEQEGESQEHSPQGTVRNPFSLFRTLRPGTQSTPVSMAPANIRKELVDPLSNVFIVEGYTAKPKLTTVKAMVDRLKTSSEIVRVDLLSDDQWLKPAGVPDIEEEKLPDFKRFILEIEVKKPTIASDK